MKARLFKIPKGTNHPINAQYEYSERQYKKFHFHEEVQLTYVKKGRGIVICGNSSIEFEEGNLLIFGSNLSHVMVGEDDMLIESVSIYFQVDWLRNIYPESNFLEHFIGQTNQGLKIEHFKHSKMIDQVLNKSGLVKIIAFFQLLEHIGETANKQRISDENSIPSYDKKLDASRLNLVYEYISKNYTGVVKLEEVANVASMTPHAFCRYFKQRTQKTLSQFVMELRITRACKLLIESDFTIEEVCYKCGYNNFSNFIRQFKKIKNQTPKEFRAQRMRL